MATTMKAGDECPEGGKWRCRNCYRTKRYDQGDVVGTCEDEFETPSHCFADEWVLEEPTSVPASEE